MFIPKYFELYELVPPNTYWKYHLEPVKLWGIFDDRLLRTIERLRVRYGKMVMNTWYWGGHHKERGWRHENTLTGALFSQHKNGRAGDLVPTEVSPDQIRRDILADPWHPDFKYITCLEMNIPWLHIDLRNHNKGGSGILLVYPNY